MTRREAALSRTDRHEQSDRDHRRLAGWCVAIAAAGTPAAAAVLIVGDGPSSAAGVSVIATISVAAFATARSLARSTRGSGADRQEE